MFIGVRKRIRRHKFIVLFTRISGYVCRRISRMRELRYKGRSSPDGWIDRVGWLIYIVRCIPRFFAGSEFLLMVARRDRRVKNASYFARLYLCLSYISDTEFIAGFRSTRDTDMYVEALISRPFLHLFSSSPHSKPRANYFRSEFCASALIHARFKSLGRGIWDVRMCDYASRTEIYARYCQR